MADTSLKRLGLALDLAVAICFFLAWMPLNPMMPTPGIGGDQGEYFALNQIVADGLRYGRDIHYHYGPLFTLIWPFYHPGTHGLSLACSAWFLAAFMLVYVLGFRGRPLALKVMFLLSMALVSGAREVTLAFYALMVGDFALGLTEVGDTGRLNDRRTVASLAFLYSALGLASLAKFSVTLCCLASFAISIALLASSGLKLRNAAIASSGLLLGLGIPSALANQGLTGFIGFFRAAIQGTLGYGEAVSRPFAESYIPEAGVVCFLLACVACAALLLTERSIRPAHRLYLLCLFAPVTFVMFKNGYVHLYVSYVIRPVLILGLSCILLLARLSRFKVALTWVGLTAIGGLIVAAATFHYNIIGLDGFRPGGLLYKNVASAFALSFPSKTELDGEFLERCRYIKEYSDIPPLGGTTDIYPSRYDELIASGNQWNPRPSLCFSATSALLDLDLAHLLSPQRPDNIIFRLIADKELPALTDGASYPVFISRYEPFMYHRGRLYLRHRPESREVSIERLGTDRVTGSFNREIRLPNHSGVVLARMGFRMTPAGRLMNLLLVPSRLSMRLHLADGTEREYRIVSTKARTEFVLSPFIEDTADFGFLFAGPWLNPGKRVLSIEVRPLNCPWEWEDAFEIEMTPIEYKTDPQVKNLLDLRFRVNGL